METLILMMDTAAVLVVVIYSLRNQKRPEDTDEFGPFRIKPARPPAPAAPQAATPAPGRRRRNRVL